MGMTPDKSIEIIKNMNFCGLCTTGNCSECGRKITKDEVIRALEEIKQYRAIGTPDECRAAVEKQKEMIAYCDENDCSDCPYHGCIQKENRCMNDFIADEIVKGGGVNAKTDS